MGGKKKISLKRVEKTQTRKGREHRERKSTGPSTEKKGIGIDPPDPKSEKIINELKKMKALTPYAIATRFDLRLSIAKDFLEELEKLGVVEYVSGSKNLKLYKTID